MLNKSDENQYYISRASLKTKDFSRVKNILIGFVLYTIISASYATYDSLEPHVAPRLSAIEQLNIPPLPEKSLRKKAASNPNKEHYHLLEQNFSKGSVIDYQGIYTHLHYTFKTKSLFEEAIYPLLPAALQHSEKKFEQLEFLGDSILGFIIKERILNLFPNEERGTHNLLYESLTCNMTLADIYVNNLNIERYLPYPGLRQVRYCDIMEAIIGAIYKDDEKKGLLYAKSFIMRVLDDGILHEKWKEILIKKPKAAINPDLPQPQCILRYIDEFSHLDCKSLLTIILKKSFQDEPEYQVYLGKNEDNKPGYVVNIIAAQVGSIKGFGITMGDAEQEAARQAINFLARTEVFPPKLLTHSQDYRTFIQQYCQRENLALSFTIHTPHAKNPFCYYVEVENNIISYGEGAKKSEAAEMAAYTAYTYLIDNAIIDPVEVGVKRYKSVLEELNAQKKIVGYSLKEREPIPLEKSVSLQLKVGEDISIEATGVSKKEAKENACLVIFELLLANQEAASMTRKISKVPGPLKTTPSVSSNSTPSLQAIPQEPQQQEKLNKKRKGGKRKKPSLKS